MPLTSCTGHRLPDAHPVGQTPLCTSNMLVQSSHHSGMGRLTGLELLLPPSASPCCTMSWPGKPTYWPCRPLGKICNLSSFSMFCPARAYLGSGPVDQHNRRCSTSTVAPPPPTPGRGADCDLAMRWRCSRLKLAVWTRHYGNDLSRKARHAGCTCSGACCGRHALLAAISNLRQCPSLAWQGRAQ